MITKKSIGLMVLSSVALVYAATTSSLTPTAGGTYTSWTPSTGSVHYSLVNEASCNGNTNYVKTTTVGAKDSYVVSLASIPDGSTITNISITPCASKNASSGSATMSVFYRLNGTDSATSAPYTLSGTTPTSLSASNLSASTTKNASTTLEIGQVLSSGTAGARLSRIATVITYTPPAIPPAAPSNLSAVPFASSTVMKISWTDNSNNEDRFIVERSTDGVVFNTVASTTANVVTVNDSSASHGVLYYYRAYASNAYGTSSYTNVATGTLP